MIRLHLELVLIPLVSARHKRLVRPNLKGRDEALETGVERVLYPCAVLEICRERDVIRVRHLLVVLIEIDVEASVRMQLADAVLPQPPGSRPQAEVDEMFAAAGSLDEADVVAKMIADREQRILAVDEVVVPRHRPLACELAAVAVG